MENEYLKLIKRISIDGVIWEYITQGTRGNTFLILPGGGQTAQSNFQLIEEFKKEYNVIAITIYQSESIENCCFAINQILNKEKANQNITLYGLSLGGLIAQSYLKRNLDKIKAAIFSHACTSKSKRYKSKIIIPLKILKPVLPLIPNSLIKLTIKKFSSKAQGANTKINPTNKTLKFFNREFYEKYLNKTLLQTWVNLHLDFYQNEKFDSKNFSDWKGKVLVIRSNDDPLMQDEGDFKKVYPNLTIYSFENTGHLSYYYKFDETVRIIKKFCKIK